jgi:hypothetical protein
MLRDLVSNLKKVSSLVPAVRNSDTNGAAIDTQGYGSAAVLVHFGDSADTLSGTNKIEVEMEHSDDNSSWSDCADADLSTSVVATNTGTMALIDAPAEDQTAIMVGYKGSKRYIRPVLNFSGTHTTGIPCGAVGLLSDAQLAPVS